MMKKILAFLFLAVYLLVNTQAQSIDQPYEYPVKGGTPEWKKLKSRKEKGEVCQIPSVILHDLTTRALVETCLNYPLFKDLYFFNNIQTGFNLQKESFNGFQELFKRTNRMNEILKVYQQMEPRNIAMMSDETERGSYAFTFVSIEILLSQPENLDFIEESLIPVLKKEAIKKYESKIANEYSMFTTSPSVLILGRLLEKTKSLEELKAKNQDGSVQYFLEFGTAHNKEILDEIYILSKK